MAKRSSKAREAEANARAAEANAAALAAQAQAGVERERIAAQRESTRIAADAAKRKEDADNSPLQRAYHIGLNVVAPIAGMAAGHKVAKHIEARHVQSMQAVAQQVASLAKEARKAVSASGAKHVLPGIVKAANALKYTKMTGPLGLPTAALLLAEGAYTRFGLAPEVEKDSPAAAETLRSIGTASTFAATSIVGARWLQNRSPTTVPNGRDVAAIENAKAMAPKARKLAGGINAAEAAKAVDTLSKASKALKILGKVSLVATGVVATVKATTGYMDDGVRGAGRGVVDTLDPTTLFMKDGQPGLGERAYNRMFGKSPTDSRAAISGARVVFGRMAARHASIEMSTPLQLPSAGQTPGAVKVTADGRHQGWTDAARAASAKARGVALPGQARR
jgi:hypothetical protein